MTMAVYAPETPPEFDTCPICGSPLMAWNHQCPHQADHDADEYGEY